MAKEQEKPRVKIAGEIERWTKNLEVLRGDLAKAQKVKQKASDEKAEIVLEARTGNKAAKAQVKKLREVDIRASPITRSNASSDSLIPIRSRLG